MILSDVLQEACGKLGADASRYGLKYKNKNIDLSNPIRLSGLSPGAKVELVLLSRSPSVVSVALQLSESDARGLPAGRLIEKYPSSTTLWLILRDFESKAPHQNYTARGKTKSETGDSGAGRLYHEAPVINIMGRELACFTDLQKSLAQLGFNSGSVLLRLTFRVSDTPLEEAMDRIGQYFHSMQIDERAGAQATSITTMESILDAGEPIAPKEDNQTKTPLAPVTPPNQEVQHTDRPGTPQETVSLAPSEPATSTVTGPGQRPMQVYRPPESSTPRAAQQAFDERDYEPTIAHAKLHQARLQSSGRNKTLLSDKELAEREDAKAQRVADIKEIVIRLRFPDQSAASATFNSLDTAATLYDFAKGLLANEDEPFLLNFRSAKGPCPVPRDGTSKLISDLGMSGSTLVNVLWGEGASSEAWAKPVLKNDMMSQAKEYEVPRIPEVNTSEPLSPGPSTEKGKENGRGGSRGGRPKWFKGLGKK
ncbi:MAG: hypothetical protein Q9182_000179 [Xanthomendoza sp. 2 TL-2023]